MKTQIFNNAEATELLDRYSRHPHSLKLREQIMTATYPLIDAAISKKRLFLFRDDLKQECALKVLKALPKFKGEKVSKDYVPLCSAVLCLDCEAISRCSNQQCPSCSSKALVLLQPILDRVNEKDKAPCAS